MDDCEVKSGYATSSLPIFPPTTYSTVLPQRHPYNRKMEISNFDAGEAKMKSALVLKDGRLAGDRGSDKDNGSATLRTRTSGHICCCCIHCDARQTVILINLIHIVLQICIAAILFAPWRSIPPIGREVKLQHFIAYVVVTRTANILGMFGAIRYNIYLVGLDALYYFISMVMYFVEDAVVLSMIAGALVYPHIHFIRQMQNGSTPMS